jgi:hypothetical protein
VSLIFREAEAIRFVSQHTNVPTPQIIDQRVDDSGFGYFTMRIVSGKSISTVWHHIDQTQRMSIVADLKDHINQLRSLEQPDPEWIGSYSHEPTKFKFPHISATFNYLDIISIYNQDN